MSRIIEKTRYKFLELKSSDINFKKIVKIKTK